MTPEQIEKLWNMGSEILNRPIGTSKEFRTEDVRPIFDLALVALPKAFDLQNPPNEGWYFARQKKFYSWTYEGAQKTHYKITWRVSYFESGQWFHKKGGIYTYEEITHFIPLPKGESK